MKSVVKDGNPIVTRGPSRFDAVHRNIWVLGSSWSEILELNRKKEIDIVSVNFVLDQNHSKEIEIQIL